MFKRSIIFVTSHTSKGGTLDYIFALKGHFENHGYVCSIVAIRKGLDHDPRSEIEVMSTNKGFLALPQATVAFIRDCLRKRPAIILGVMPFANVLGALSGIVCGAKVVATHHTPYETHGRILRFLDKLTGTASLYAKIFCVSNAVAYSFKYHSERYRKCIRVIRNGVPPVNASQSVQTDVISHFRLSDELPIILMIGRLSSEKNVLNVINAIADVEGVQLVLAGEGPLRSTCEALVDQLKLRGRVLLLGTVTKTTVAALLHISDVFVQVSYYEGNSLALLEAISVGAVIVVSSVPSQIEAVSLADGSLAALACDPNSSRSIGQAIRAAAFDTLLRSKLERSVCELAVHLQTENKMLLEYEQEFHTL